MVRNMSVTVAVATKDRWHMIKDCIDSILRQGPMVEAIFIIDDNSDDAPSLVDLGIYDRRVSLIRNQKNLKLARNRNLVIEACQTSYFTFLDDDDVWSKGLLERLLGALKNDKNNGMAIEIANDRAAENLKNKSLSMEELFLFGITPPVGAQLYDAQLIKSAGGYNANTISGVDHDLWVNLLGRDVRCGISVGVGSKINIKAVSASRMTNRQTERIEGIKKSLKNWQPKIISALGAGFFRHFSSDYRRYLAWHFFREQPTHLKRFEYLVRNPIVLLVSISKIRKHLGFGVGFKFRKYGR